MTQYRIAIAQALMFAASPCLADTTAVYKSAKYSGEMTVEVASNGNIRATFGGRGDYSLTIDGVAYIVFTTDKGVVADRLDDAAAALADYVKEKMPEFGKMPDFDGPKLVAGGSLTVNGRAGTVWYTQFDGKMSTDPATVISADPQLAELGRAMSVQYQMSATMMGQMLGRSGKLDGMGEALRTGAPLRYSGMELASVSFAPIPADRFVLPVQPETREQVAIRLRASGGHIP